MASASTASTGAAKRSRSELITRSKTRFAASRARRVEPFADGQIARAQERDGNAPQHPLGEALRRQHGDAREAQADELFHRQPRAALVGGDHHRVDLEASRTTAVRLIAPSPPGREFPCGAVGSDTTGASGFSSPMAATLASASGPWM